MADDVDTEGSGGEMELFTLKASTVLTIAFGIAGVTIAIICDSMTMMLDGLYGGVDVVVSFLAIAIVRKIHLPPNEKYHFGYAKGFRQEGRALLIAWCSCHSKNPFLTFDSFSIGM